jgi:hypothetical protein
MKNAYCSASRTEVVLSLFEIALVSVRFDHGAGFVQHADDCWMRARVKFRVFNGIIGREIPQPAEWQPVGD